MMHDGGNAPEWSNQETEFLSALLFRLANEEPAVHSRLIHNDPQLAYLASKDSRLLQMISSALSEGDIIPADLPGTTEQEPQGQLTSLTEQLSPEDAIELYRRVTPLFLFALLSELNRSTDTKTISDLVDHLCDEETQNRLRQCEHVRDGILAEIANTLNEPITGCDLTRDDLQVLIERSGAARHLVAMENCIKLSVSKAG